jgi:hypothetical protein
MAERKKAKSYYLESMDAECLLGELDVVKHDERTLDVQDGSVINSRRDVIVSGHGLNVYL